MFNPKMESINKKMTKSTPKHNVFCFFVVVLWNIMQQLIIYRWPRKLRKRPWFLANVAVNSCQDQATLFTRKKFAALAQS